MNETKHEMIAEAEFDLVQAGFGFITNNGGVHLQVSKDGKRIADYWPTTKRLIIKAGCAEDRKALKQISLQRKTQ